MLKTIFKKAPKRGHTRLDVYRYESSTRYLCVGYTALVYFLNYPVRPEDAGELVQDGGRMIVKKVREISLRRSPLP